MNIINLDLDKLKALLKRNLSNVEFGDDIVLEQVISDGITYNSIPAMTIYFTSTFTLHIAIAESDEFVDVNYERGNPKSGIKSNLSAIAAASLPIFGTLYVANKWKNQAQKTISDINKIIQMEVVCNGFEYHKWPYMTLRIKK